MKSVSGKKIARILENKGWILVDVNGSHFKYYKNNKVAIVPIHGNKDLKIGTLRTIMKQANLTEDDLIGSIHPRFREGMLLEEICHSRENTESKTYLIIHQKPPGFCAYAGMTEIKKYICQKWMLPFNLSILIS
jgi:predicted RNA binding protein YcfA (HicA-like mRNA interferase family)